MTTDSMPIPTWSEVRAALDAQRRRQDEQRREQSTINWLRGAGAAMAGLGAITGVVLLVAFLANREADQLRHVINPYATLFTLGGLIVLGVGVIRAAGLRDRDAIFARLDKIERIERQRRDAEDMRSDVVPADERISRVKQSLIEQSDDAFVDKLSAQLDAGNGKVTRLIRPPYPDDRRR